MLSYSGLSAGVRAALEAAAALLRDGKDGKGSADPYITDEKGLKADGYGKWKDENGWGDRIRCNVSVTHLDYLFALCVVASPKFHAAAAAAFAAVAGCDHRPAPMKTQARCEAKCSDPDEYGKLLPPESQHLKDILRCTVACDGLTALGAAYDAALEAFEVVSVKVRLEEATHDVVLVARFEGVLVELQLHFTVVLAMKALSHGAYNFVRMDTTDLFAMKGSGVFGYELDELGGENSDASKHVTCPLLAKFDRMRGIPGSRVLRVRRALRTGSGPRSATPTFKPPFPAASPGRRRPVSPLWCVPMNPTDCDTFAPQGSPGVVLVLSGRGSRKVGIPLRSTGDINAATNTT